MTTAPPLAPVSTPSAPLPAPTTLLRMTGRYDGPKDLAGQIKLAHELAKAREAIPPMYRGNSGDVLAAIYQAKALDVAVMTALQQFTYNRGKGGMSGALMHALILRAGHKVVLVNVEPGKKVAMRFERGDGGQGGEVEWTILEAQRAGLTKKDVWQAYPTDLLWWRCLARGARRYMSDVVQGFGYTPEELANLTPDDGGETDPTETDKPVHPLVQEVIAALYDEGGELSADEAAVRAAWYQMQKEGLLGEYAGKIDDTEYNANDLLIHLANVAKEKAQKAADEARAAQDLASEAGDEPAGPDPEHEPAGEGVLSCGCPAAEVVATGNHLEGCPERIGAPSEAPEATEAPQGLGDGR